MKSPHKLSLSRRPIFLLLFGLVLANATHAQTPPQYTNNTADAGSRSEMRVDPSTLALGFQLSLGNYPGRAGSSLPSNISYSSKVWRIEFEDIFPGVIPRSRVIPKYAQHSAAGWTTNFDVPSLEGLEWQPYDSAGAGICMSPSCPQPDPNEAILYVYRLLAHMPDGSTHELRRDDTPTQSHTTGNVYYAVDGSRIRYHENNQTLYLPDGSRYVYATNSVQYIDRNGNTLSYNPSTKQWSDTLGRSIGRPPLATGTTGYVTYSLPGVAGSTVTYRLRWRYLSEVLTTANPLRYKGDRTWTNPTMQTLSPSLFSSWPVPDEYVMTEVTALFNPVVLNEVELPNGRRYTFTYNVWGEIDKVVYPTGGYERYVYGPIDGISTSLQRSAYAQANRGVVDRWVSVTGDGSDEAQNHWHYAATGTNSPYTVTITAPDGSYTKRLLHGGENSDMRFGFDDVRNGMAYDESSYSASGQMLRRTLTELVKSGPLPGGEGTATRDPRVTKTVEIILDTGGDALTKTTSYGYDVDLNRISTNEYNFVSVSQTTGQMGAIGSITAGTLLRTSEATYLVNDAAIAAATRDAYRARNLVGLPTSSRIKNAAGSIVAQSSISYDEAAYPLLTYGTVTGWTDPATTVRGNATTTRSWLNTTGVYFQTHAQYDQCGSMRKTWDARDTLLTNPTQVTYLDAFSDGVPRNTYAFPTSVNTAVPDPTGQYGSTTALVSTSVYDFTSGAMTSSTDANNKITTTDYAAYDVLGNANPMQRPTRVNRPDASWTAYGYSDQPGSLYVLARTSLDTTRSVDATKYFDGLGRAWRVAQSEGATSIFADTQYDSLGRAWKTSNPYRAGETILWTTSGFDPLSRVISVTTPDNAVVTTSYAGTAVTVTDQTGKARKSVSDALGRLKEIYEDPSGLNYLTTYNYDVLDNLLTVNQGGQTRTFVYDSLKRLTSATNPESGTIGYVYDVNGNLTQKTDARGIVSTYAYDALNRNTTVNYSNTSGINPDITRVYDTATNGKGRLRESYAGGTETVGATVEHTKILSYDALGRPTDQRQRFKTASVWSAEYQTQRGYNRAGAVTLQTYPSGRTATYAYDNAGRASSFTGTLGDSTSRTYSTGILYSPLGGMTKEQFGTDTVLYNKSFYNSRGQLSEIRVSTSYTGFTDTTWNRGAIINHYSNTCWGMCGGSGVPTPMTDNNGNLKKQDVYIPLNEQASSYTMWTDQFDYDSLNRLQRVKELNEGSATLWQQEYVYDRWGNRTLHQTNTWGTGINKKNFTVNTANNRLGVPVGQTGAMTYDTAGNLTTDTYSGAGVTRVYDAENRMTSETQASSYLAGVYTYNADGQRVRRKVGGVETRQVYGMDGELLAEYAPNGAVTAPQKEYGYRNGQLLITAESAGPQNVVWQNAVGVSAAGNNLTKTAATAWGNGGAASTQSIVSGDGYVEFTATETNKDRVCGLSNGDANQSWTDIDFGLYMRADGKASIVEFGIYYSAINVPIATGDLLRVSIEGGVVKYKKNGTVFHTSGATATYPLRVDTAFYTTASTLSNVVISGNLGSGSAATINWLVADQLGTPRMVFDKTGALATTKRHDYLPFGEELFAGQGLRTTALGYTGDTIRQKFTSKERDNESGLDYFLARYYSSTQGRFTSVDPFNIALDTQMAAELNPERAKALFNAYLSQPQQWNRYSYAINNPLLYVDPTGESIQLSNDKDERARQMQALREALKGAGEYIYENLGEDGNYYVGIYDNGPGGNGPTFEQLNEVAGEYGAIIRDTQVVTLEFVGRGNVTDDFGNTVYMGRASSAGGRVSPAVTGVFNGKLTIKMLDWSKNDLGYLPGDLMSNGKDNMVTGSVMQGHELGHARAWMTGYHDKRVIGPSREGSLRLENKIRKLQFPNGPTRKRH